MGRIARCDAEYRSCGVSVRSQMWSGRSATCAVLVVLVGLAASCSSTSGGSVAPQVEVDVDQSVSNNNSDADSEGATAVSPAPAPVVDGASALSLYVGASPKVHRLDLGSGEWTTFSVTGSPVSVDEDWLVADTALGIQALRLDDPMGDPVDLGAGDVAWGPAAPSGHIWQRGQGAGETPRYRLRELETGEEVFALPTSIAWPQTGVFDPQLAGEPVTGIFAFENGEYERLSDDRLLAAGIDHLLSRSCSVPTDCTTRWLDRATGAELPREAPDRSADSYVMSANGRLVAGLNSTGSIWVFDAEAGSYVIDEADLLSKVRGRSFSLAPDGSLVAVVSEDGEVAIHNVDTGETTIVETNLDMGRAETVLLAWAPGAAVNLTEPPVIADYPPEATTVVEPLPSAESAFNTGTWTILQLEAGQPMPGIEGGLSLLSGDNNSLDVLDLGSGRVEQLDGVGVPTRQTGDWVVFSGDGTVKAAPARSPGDVVEVVAEPIYFSFGLPANSTRPGQRPGQLWLNTIGDKQSVSDWRLVDFDLGEVVERTPVTWWHQHTTLTSATDRVQTSESGGVFEFSDDGYQRVLDGTLKAVADTHVLVETCTAPGRCTSRWFSREDWSEVDWPSPPSPVYHGSLSEGGRVLHYWSHEGHAYLESATGELIHLQSNLSLRDDVSADGRYITATHKGNLETYIIADLDTYTIYVVQLDLTDGSSMPVLVPSN